MKVRSHLMQWKLFCFSLVFHLKIVNLNAEIKKKMNYPILRKKITFNPISNEKILLSYIEQRRQFL